MRQIEMYLKVLIVAVAILAYSSVAAKSAQGRATQMVVASVLVVKSLQGSSLVKSKASFVVVPNAKKGTITTVVF